MLTVYPKKEKKIISNSIKKNFLNDSCYFKSLTADCLLKLFFEKNTFRNKARAIKLTEIKVLATVATKPSVVCGKLHKYEINFIQTFFRKTIRVLDFLYPHH